ncbi:hypothetical protein GCM10025771_19710 [Niveibacterium umoris]|uniref:Bacterial Ig-like domain-containing protein n=1 Tax=Niveibacterium umoris TaxID=1193620 RepID=A0A840BH14_9RHOO|nr:Ig-like domain-containing protein [Niveibacterium umoris]MBB4012841.1 hypothetical protein [Niveibacterium umoris]
MNLNHKRFALSALSLALSAILTGCGGSDSPAVTTAAKDTTPPSVTISSSASGQVAKGDVTFTFTFSEDVGTSFTADDIVVTGGSVGAFTRVSGTSATLVVTPASASAGTINVGVAAGKFVDLASNANTAAAAVSQDFSIPVAVESGNTGKCTAAPCVGFEGANVGLNAFEGLGSATVENDPVDATNKVAKLVKVAAGQPWAGATVYTDAATKSVAPIGFSATNKTVTLRVYSPAAGDTIMLKVETGPGAGGMEAQAKTTKVNAWETLTFDYTTPTNGVPYDFTKTYNTISIFPAFMASVSADKAYYFDELNYPAAAAGGGGSGGGSGSGLVTLANGVYASNYTDKPTPWKSVEGGDAGRYIDTGVTTQDWWSGLAAGDATPSFYFGYGVNVAAKPWGFGAFVKAPGNGVANVASYANLKVAVWGNDQLINAHPTFTVILKGGAANGCTPELEGAIAPSAIGVQSYTLPLSGFTLKTACTYTTAAQALAAGVAEVHIQVLGSNLQYTAGGDGSGNYPNGLNIGPISFN